MSTDNSNLARIPSAFQTPASFVSGLPKVSYTDFPDNECCICREDFDASQATNDGEDGRLDTIDQRYIALTHQIAGLDPQSPTSWRTLEAIQEELDEVMQQVDSHIQRPIPHLRPWVGRKINLTNFILETETPLLESDLAEGESSLEDGEIPAEGLLEIIQGTTGEPGTAIPEHAPIDSSSFPPKIREALQADFEGMPTAEIWNTLRSRRFALDLPCRFLHEFELPEKLAGWLYVGDEIISEYTSDTAFRERAPRREWHWQLNAAGDTLEYAGEWY